MKFFVKILLSLMLLVVTFVGNCSLAVCSNLNPIQIATLNSNETNLRVRLFGKPEVSDENKVKATITSDLTATMDVENLNKKGESVFVKYPIQNVSTDLSVNLSVETQNSNKEYFLVDSKLEKTLLSKGESTFLIVTIELIKTPIEGNQNNSIYINLIADPVQPDNQTSPNDDSNSGRPDGTINTQGDNSKDNTKDKLNTKNKKILDSILPFTGDNLPIVLILIILLVIILNMIPQIIKIIKNKIEKKKKKY